LYCQKPKFALNSEATQRTVDAFVITVVRHDIEEVSSAVSAVLGSTSGLTGLGNVTATLNTQFSLLESALDKISKDMAAKVTEATAAAGDLETVFNQLGKISNEIKKLGATKGLNLEKIYEVSKDKKDDIIYLKNKTQELKAAMELNHKMIENVAKKPIVQTWFEFR
jgi:hypothetical protein